MNSDRYNKLKGFFQKKFGGRVEKLCIDGGFTCPNRDGTCGVGGCSFCVQPARDNITSKDITYQVKAAIKDIEQSKTTDTKLCKQHSLQNKTESRTIKTEFQDNKTDFQDNKTDFQDNKTDFQDNKTEFQDNKTDFQDNKTEPEDRRFIVYFQNYSGTYAPLEELKEKYDAALCDPRIVGLSIATRPDCITDETVELLKEYSKSYYVYVEMGLQTSSDETARLINRGYDTSLFSKATKALQQNGIDVVAHLIFGLPSETDDDIARTINYINGQGVRGVKIHSLYITKGTRLYQSYEKGQYIPQEFDDYIRRLTYAITHLKEDIVIHRITGDCPRGRLVAPEWNNRKKLIRNALEKALQDKNLSQGCFYCPD